MAAFDAYYEGDHRLHFATAKFREAFGHLFQAIADNWMQIVVDSSVERLRVQGFRFGDDADDDAWGIWQANGLDATSNMLHTEAVKLGEAYWLVEPPADGDVPRITSEHPSQVIVAHAPGDRRRREAALKRWFDDGFAFANVYLPNGVVKYRSAKRLNEGGIAGSRPDWRQVDSFAHRLGAVPVVPVCNNPSMLRGGRSDLAGGPIHIQNAVNKLMSDMLIGSEYQAFPQRVLLGVEPPRYPAGHSRAGEVMREADLKASQSRLWMFPGENSKAFEFSAADLKNYTEASQHLVRHLSAQTRTPPHYILGEIVNASGDALKAAETGLVSKVRDKMDPFGEAHEEAMRLAFRSLDADDPRGSADDAETIWRDPESRSQAELADSLTKLATIGVPQEVLWERYGFSPQEIDRMKDMQEADALLAASRVPADAADGTQPADNGPVPQPA